MDSNMYEWAIIANECKIQFYFIDNSRWAFPFFAFILPLIEVGFLWSLFFALLSILSCFCWVRFNNEHTISESIQRCSDPAYIDLLVQYGYELMDQKVADRSSERGKINVEAPSKPASTTFAEKSTDSLIPRSPTRIQPKEDSQSPNCSPENASQKISKFMWLGVKLFISQTHSKLILHGHAYLWAAYLYVLAKTIRNQQIIDQIYSYFQIEAKSYLGDRYRGVEPYVILSSSYKRFAVVLNGSKIDPRTDAGMKALWYIVSQWVFDNQDIPDNAEKSFFSNCQMILAIAHTSFKKDRSSESGAKYSISVSSEYSNCSLPE